MVRLFAALLLCLLVPPLGQPGDLDKQIWAARARAQTIAPGLRLPGENPAFRKTAAGYLLEAGRTPGSPQLSSFGPNMQLARELLEAGETRPVLEYFELCRKFWPSPALDAWAAEVRAGQIPEFGANLKY